ncbi:hypothetical protein NHN26_15895 [Rhodovulum tesquicola]|uniref:hypothetical protein n=1 Tax=Rhodovulum tesquicola TaxID=540254 RepID=UPI0020977DAA|nr:hypothetical protein [Rhodovulum tesquicola]MCO8146696.1 hypothetical protein [Rhodovulum tesquicola]
MLKAWLDEAGEIDGRRPSAARDAAIRRHAGRFPFDVIRVEIDRTVLHGALALLKGGGSRRGFARPP